MKERRRSLRGRLLLCGDVLARTGRLGKKDVSMVQRLRFAIALINQFATGGTTIKVVAIDRLLRSFRHALFPLGLFASRFLIPLHLVLARGLAFDIILISLPFWDPGLGVASLAPESGARVQARFVYSA